MTTRTAAARHVVERCPSCGVEHDTSADSVCEACDTPLRAWCRTHSREFGWLDDEACPRCAREAAPHPASPPRANPSSAPRRAAVVPARPSPPVLWGEALTEVAVKTAGGAVSGVVTGSITALAIGADVASMAGTAAAVLGFVGFAVGAALGCAIVLEDG